MSPVILPAHFDGNQILLDAPYSLDPEAKLLVTVLPKEGAEEADWRRLSLQNFAAAYGEDEPEYSLDLVKEVNPEYEGR